MSINTSNEALLRDSRPRVDSRTPMRLSPDLRGFGADDPSSDEQQRDRSTTNSSSLLDSETYNSVFHVRRSKDVYNSRALAVLAILSLGGLSVVLLVLSALWNYVVGMVFASVAIALTAVLLPVFGLLPPFFFHEEVLARRHRVRTWCAAGFFFSFTCWIAVLVMLHVVLLVAGDSLKLDNPDASMFPSRCHKPQACSRVLPTLCANDTCPTCGLFSVGDKSNGGDQPGEPSDRSHARSIDVLTGAVSHRAPRNRSSMLFHDVPFEQLWSRAKHCVRSHGGQIRRTQWGWQFHAVFVSTLFGFVDDVFVAVVQMPTASCTTVAIQSESRVGHSDLGVNPKRVSGLLGCISSNLALAAPSCCDSPE